MRLRRIAAGDPEAVAAAEASRPSARRQRRQRRALLGDFGSAALLLIGFVVLLFGGRIALAAIRATGTESPSERAEARAAEQPETPIEPTLARFEASWRTGVDELEALYPERLRRRAGRLDRRFREHGLAEPLPALGARDRQHRPLRADRALDLRGRRDRSRVPLRGRGMGDGRPPAATRR